MSSPKPKQFINASLFESMWLHQAFGLLIRLVLILYGSYHDKVSSLPYTDIDYHVVTDAARHVYNGGSPFLRHTYRYTPLLSWLMLPNIVIHFIFGKVLLSLLDGVAASTIYKMLLLQGYCKEVAVKCSLIWLYNPIVIGISTRGSPESLVVTVVLFVLYYSHTKKVFLSGLALGVAVHLKIYPIIYCLPLYLSLEQQRPLLSFRMFLPTFTRIKFTLATAFSFLTLTVGSYILYGQDYINESFLYHISRVDTRHNFSVYFYQLYLSVDYSIPGLGLLCFAPQVFLLICYGVVYGCREHLVLSLFAQTVSFVTFNKVVTSQYFLWYLVFIPLIYCKLRLTKWKMFGLPSLWVLAQVCWLLPAYLFEFQGFNVFIPIWLESVAFFCCNVGILMAVISGYWDCEYTVAKNH